MSLQFSQNFNKSPQCKNLITSYNKFRLTCKNTIQSKLSPIKKKQKNKFTQILVKKFKIYAITQQYQSKMHTPQDSFYIEKYKNILKMGIFDGHGKLGHQISQSALNLLKKVKINNNFSKIHLDKFFIHMNEQFSNMQEAFQSGSTANIIIIVNDKIFIGNLGDSKCIIYRKNYSINLWEKIFQTKDHKPVYDTQKYRILSIGQFINNSSGVTRITNGKKGGFSVSRSLGDLKYFSIGIINTPDIYQLQIAISKRASYKQNSKSYSDYLIVQGTDGLWQVIMKYQLLELINEYNPSTQQDLYIFNRKLMKMALSRWLKIGYDDDITFNTCLIK